MKICVAQTRPIKGDIPSNIARHKRLLELAVSNGADTVIFQPRQARQTYSKKYLHADEEEFFISGQSSVGLIGNIALAICYEISIPAHAENAFKSGAEIYIASVAKSASGVDQAVKNLSGIAKKY